jgi:hypothetical protein
VKFSGSGGFFALTQSWTHAEVQEAFGGITSEEVDAYWASKPWEEHIAEQREHLKLFKVGSDGWRTEKDTLDWLIDQQAERDAENRRHPHQYPGLRRQTQKTLKKKKARLLCGSGPFFARLGYRRRIAG